MFDKKRFFSFLLAGCLLLGLCACNRGNGENLTGESSETGLSASDEEREPSDFSEENSSSGSSGSVASDSTATASDSTVTASETTADFTIKTADGNVTNANGVYTISKAGTYTLTGLLQGQILVQAGKDDEVILELNGTTVTYGKDSPIKIISAGKVEISAKDGTENVVKDTRKSKTEEESDAGEGAISSKADLKLKGSGTLVVTGNYNNGIHTTKDLTIQKLSLKVTAYGNALKGNDSVTVKSGTVVAISTNGDGVKTSNTDADTSGNTRGDILLTGGTITVYAAGDGFQAAHDFEMAADAEGNTPKVTVYTGSYSSYTATDATTTSYKGVKAQNLLNVKAGTIDIKSYDDGLHADYGTSFTAGGKGQGTVNVSGGTVTVSVYAPETKSGGGQMGPGRMQTEPMGMGGPGSGGFGGQQRVSGADAIHADYALNITGGTIRINSAYEGLEANVITVTGGKTYVTASDDGVNACKGQTTPQVIVKGGYLDVTVSPNGDTDGIDSNGTYTQTGGVVITRGPSNEMAAAIDADRAVGISGGTLIVLGYGRVNTSGNVKSYSLSLHTS
ncbi:MAG: carbohydrate-binding domain-containing protein, partial [Clostridia bacterium]|nr:carbohydrate-binding domain-containing protein [Clostridia bacterium]